VKPAGLLLLLALCAAQAAADELRLKDGSKIVGNIVGYEGDSFKVETSYGFAIVKKDKVASIIIGDSPAAARPAPGAAPPPAAAPAQKPEPPPAVPAPAPAGAPPKTTPAPSSSSSANPPAAAPAPPSSQPAPAASQPPPAKSPPAAETKRAEPARPAVPPPIREEVSGTTYRNLTYGFQMYKPPSWRLIADARKALPTAVAAMGTDDENTLFIVGREDLRSTVEAHAAQTERRLRDIYENYRSLSEKRTRVAGLAAIEKKFRGLIGQQEWSATLLTFARGSDLYTVLGMTTADSDLIQIQENVITRAIASLAFEK
jgi:hypothetical protein